MYIDLLQIQRSSFIKFLQNGINQVFDNINPIIIANRKYIFFSKYYLLKIPSQINFVSLDNQFQAEKKLPNSFCSSVIRNTNISHNENSPFIFTELHPIASPIDKGTPKIKNFRGPFRGFSNTLLLENPALFFLFKKKPGVKFISLQARPSLLQYSSETKIKNPFNHTETNNLLTTPKFSKSPLYKIWHGKQLRLLRSSSRQFNSEFFRCTKKKIFQPTMDNVMFGKQWYETQPSMSLINKELWQNNSKLSLFPWYSFSWPLYRGLYRNDTSSDLSFRTMFKKFRTSKRRLNVQNFNGEVFYFDKPMQLSDPACRLTSSEAMRWDSNVQAQSKFKSESYYSNSLKHIRLILLQNMKNNLKCTLAFSPLHLLQAKRWGGTPQSYEIFSGYAWNKMNYTPCPLLKKKDKIGEAEFFNSKLLKNSRRFILASLDKTAAMGHDPKKKKQQMIESIIIQGHQSLFSNRKKEKTWKLDFIKIYYLNKPWFTSQIKWGKTITTLSKLKLMCPLLSPPTKVLDRLMKESFLNYSEWKRVTNVKKEIISQNPFPARKDKNYQLDAQEKYAEKNHSFHKSQNENKFIRGIENNNNFVTSDLMKTSLLTYSSEFYIPVQIIDQISKKMYLRWLLLADLPIQTKRGHFIINGYPKTVIHQIVRSPGIRFKNEDNQILADIISMRGAWMGIQIQYEKNLKAETFSTKRQRRLLSKTKVKENRVNEPMPSKRILDDYLKIRNMNGEIFTKEKDNPLCIYVKNKGNFLKNPLRKAYIFSNTLKIHALLPKKISSFYTKKTAYKLSKASSNMNTGFPPLRIQSVFFSVMQQGTINNYLHSAWNGEKSLLDYNNVAYKHQQHQDKKNSARLFTQNNSLKSKMLGGPVLADEAMRWNVGGEGLFKFPLNSIKESEKMNQTLFVHFFISPSRTDKGDKKKIKLSGFAFLNYLFDLPYFIYNNYVPSSVRSSLFPNLPSAWREGRGSLSKSKIGRNSSEKKGQSNHEKSQLRYLHGAYSTQMSVKEILPTPKREIDGESTIDLLRSIWLFRNMRNNMNGQIKPHPFFFLFSGASPPRKPEKKKEQKPFKERGLHPIASPILSRVGILSGEGKALENKGYGVKFSLLGGEAAKPDTIWNHNVSISRLTIPTYKTMKSNLWVGVGIFPNSNFASILKKQSEQVFGKAIMTKHLENSFCGYTTRTTKGSVSHVNKRQSAKAINDTNQLLPKFFNSEKFKEFAWTEQPLSHFPALVAPSEATKASVNYFYDVPFERDIIKKGIILNNVRYAENERQAFDFRKKRFYKQNLFLASLVYILNTTNFRDILFERFMNAKFYDIGLMGRKRLNKKLRLNIPLQCTTLTPLDFLAVFYKLFSLYNNFSLIQNYFPINQPSLGEPLNSNSTWSFFNPGGVFSSGSIALRENQKKVLPSEPISSPGTNNVLKPRNDILNRTVKQTASLDHLNQRHIRTCGEFLFLQFWRAILRFYQVLRQLSTRSNFIKSSYAGPGKTGRNFFSLSSVSLFPNVSDESSSEESLSAWSKINSKLFFIHQKNQISPSPFLNRKSNFCGLYREGIRTTKAHFRRLPVWEGKVYCMQWDPNISRQSKHVSEPPFESNFNLKPIQLNSDSSIEIPSDKRISTNNINMQRLEEKKKLGVYSLPWERPQNMIPITDSQTQILKAWGYPNSISIQKLRWNSQFQLWNITPSLGSMYQHFAIPSSLFQTIKTAKAGFLYSISTSLGSEWSRTANRGWYPNNTRNDTVGVVINRNDINSIFPYTPYLQNQAQFNIKNWSNQFFSSMTRFSYEQFKAQSFLKHDNVNASSMVSPVVSLHIPSFQKATKLTKLIYMMDPVGVHHIRRKFFHRVNDERIQLILHWGGAQAQKKKDLQTNFAKLQNIALQHQEIKNKILKTKTHRLVTATLPDSYAKNTDTIIKKLLYESKELRVFDPKDRLRNLETKLFNGVFKEFFNLDPLSQDWTTEKFFY